MIKKGNNNTLFYQRRHQLEGQDRKVSSEMPDAVKQSLALVSPPTDTGYNQFLYLHLGGSLNLQLTFLLFPCGRLTHSALRGEPHPPPP